MNDNIEKIKSKSDNLLNDSVFNMNKNLGDISIALIRINEKINLIFDQILKTNLLRDQFKKEIGYDFKNDINQIDVMKRINNEYNQIGFKTQLDLQRTEYVRKFDVNIVQSKDLIEIIDIFHNKKIGEFEIDQVNDSTGKSQSIIIDHKIYSKDKNGHLHIVNLLRPRTFVTKKLSNKDEQTSFINNIKSDMKLEDCKLVENLISNIQNCI